VKIVKKVLKEVLREIKPDKSEILKVKKLAEHVLRIANEVGKEYEFKPMLCGSVAKGTWLPPAEMDLFLLFPEKLSREELERKGLEAAKKICEILKANWEKKYTEHPYLRCTFEGIEMDIVPCYDTKPDKIKSAVDRTPWHVRYILEHLKEKQKDEVRLLKKFCKAQEVYGADLQHQGFSGYLCELLIIKFGSFENVVKHASNWYPPVIICLEEVSQRRNLVEEFRDQPLILLDPVDPKRNVAAAVSYETLFRFIKACKEFLKHPSKEFFFPRTKVLSTAKLRSILKKRDSRFYMIVFKKPEVHEDVLAAQLRKFQEILKMLLTKHEFSLIACDAYFDERMCIVLLEAEIWKLPKIMKRIGPEIYSKHAKEFLKHYKDKRAWLEDGLWVVEDTRKFQTIREFLEDFLKGDEKTLHEKGVPTKIAKAISKRFKIYEGDAKLIRFAEKRKDFRIWLRKYFERNLNIFED
jgi:tRNA nucleotidyltransferase (CCA-adding enzyme)